MKPLKEILSSQVFMQEISFLLFGFAALSTLTGIILMVAGPMDPESVSLAIASMILAMIQAVLALFIRRGSILALWIVALFFALDTFLNLLEPSASLLWRGVLIFLLIRLIRRERVSA